MKEPEAPVAPPFVENLLAPEAYAAEAVGFFFSHGNVHITFAVPRSSHDSEGAGVSRVVHLRLVMPVLGAEQMALGLTNAINHQRQLQAPDTGPAPVTH